MVVTCWKRPSIPSITWLTVNSVNQQSDTLWSSRGTHRTSGGLHQPIPAVQWIRTTTTSAGRSPNKPIIRISPGATPVCTATNWLSVWHYTLAVATARTVGSHQRGLDVFWHNVCTRTQTTKKQWMKKRLISWSCRTRTMTRMRAPSDRSLVWLMARSTMSRENSYQNTKCLLTISSAPSNDTSRILDSSTPCVSNRCMSF